MFILAIFKLKKCKTHNKEREKKLFGENARQAVTSLSHLCVLILEDYFST